MNAVTEWGVDFIVALQQGGDLLAQIFAVFTYIGEQEFFLLLLPLFFWSLDRAFGARLTILYLLSGILNVDLKAVIQEPRPGMIDPSLLKSEYTQPTGTGMPSGHAQLAVTVWGAIATWAKRGWFWAVAVLLAFLIGFSRIYLGAHFPHQVAAGWAIGILVVLAFVALTLPVERWLAGLPFGGQIVLAVGLPAGLLALNVEPDTVAATAVLMGVGVGLAFCQRFLREGGVGQGWQRVARYAVGIVVLLGLYFGLSMVFPGEGEALHVPLRFFRYALLGLWMSLGAPWLFQQLGLVTEESPPTLAPAS